MRISLSEMKPFIIALGVVVAVAIGGRLVMADEAPPVEVQRHADAISQNQPELAKEKAIIAEHQKRLDALKSDNAYHVGGMESFGWTYDWATKKPVKLPLAQ